MSSPGLPLIEDVHAAFTGAAIARLRQQESRIQDCLARLTADQVWSRGNENSNSIGNLILHLCGNLGQWVLAGLDGQPDGRDRDREFATQGGMSVAELSGMLKVRVEEVVGVLERVPAHRLLQPVSPQGYTLPVMEVVTHITEHFYHHGGQIQLLTKLYLNVDLGYYRHLVANNTEHAEKVP